MYDEWTSDILLDISDMLLPSLLILYIECGTEIRNNSKTHIENSIEQLRCHIYSAARASADSVKTKSGS